MIRAKDGPRSGNSCAARVFPVRDRNGRALRIGDREAGASGDAL